MHEGLDRDILKDAFLGRRKRGGKGRISRLLKKEHTLCVMSRNVLVDDLERFEK